ncbi:hypothetical protein CG51_11515 [Haematobacter missouriensis]|nr:hypothetical protein CG51_11515 [Haematobacter missouriensis]
MPEDDQCGILRPGGTAQVHARPARAVLIALKAVTGGGSGIVRIAVGKPNAVSAAALAPQDRLCIRPVPLVPRQAHHGEERRGCAGAGKDLAPALMEQALPSGQTRPPGVHVPVAFGEFQRARPRRQRNRRHVRIEFWHYGRGDASAAAPGADQTGERGSDMDHAAPSLPALCHEVVPAGYPPAGAIPSRGAIRFHCRPISISCPDTDPGNPGSGAMNGQATSSG